MALNPFFLQGGSIRTKTDTGSHQWATDYFWSRYNLYSKKICQRTNYYQEIQSSKFDDNFSLEAYVNTYEGYSGAGDVLTKFGVSLRDEVVLTISKRDLKIL